MASLYDLTWASALTGAGAFDTTSTAGDLTWVNGTGPDGSTGYCNCVIDDTTADYGLKTFTTSTTGVWIHNQYLDLDTLAVGTNTEFARIIKLWDGASASTDLAQVDVYNNAGTFALQVHAGADGDGPTQQSTIVNIGSNRPTWIEIRVDRASTDSADDGMVTYWLGGGDYPSGGQQIAQFTGVDNYDDFGIGDNIRLGATNISSSVSGQYQFDRARGDDTNHILVVENTAPTVSDPGTLYAGQNESFVFGPSVTVADTDSNLSTIRYQCGGSGGVTLDLSGGGSVSAGTNGSGDVTISGTHAQLLTAHATAAYLTAAVGNETVTVTVTDALAASDSQAFTITTAYGVLEGTQAEIQAMIAGVFSIQNTVEESCTITVTATDDDSQSAQAECVVTFAADATVGDFVNGVSHVKLSHTVGLHL